MFSVCLHISHFLVFLICLFADLNFYLVSLSLRRRTSLVFVVVGQTGLGQALSAVTHLKMPPLHFYF